MKSTFFFFLDCIPKWAYCHIGWLKEHEKVHCTFLSQVVPHRFWWMTAGRQVLVCFNPDAESLGDPVREKQQYCDVGELVKVEHKSFCILHQIQGYSGIQPGVSYSTPTSKWQETSSLRCCDVIYQYCPKCTKISLYKPKKSKDLAVFPKHRVLFCLPQVYSFIVYAIFYLVLQYIF